MADGYQRFRSCLVATTAMQTGLPTAGMSKSPLEIISLHSHLPEQGQTIPRASLNTKLPSLVLVIQKLTTTSPKGQMSTISIPPIFTTPKHPPSSTLLYPQHFGLIWRPFAQPADRNNFSVMLCLLATLTSCCQFGISGIVGVIFCTRLNDTTLALAGSRSCSWIT